MGLPSVCPSCRSALEHIYEHGSHAAVLVLCPRCGWKPDKEAAKRAFKPAREPLGPTPMERHIKETERAEALNDLLALKAELE